MLSPKLLVKRSIKSAAARAQVFRAPAPDSVTIVGYHRVVAELAEAERNSIYGLVVSTATFREHCRILRENFDVVTLDEAAAFLESGAYSGRPKAVITFDDGYLDNYEQAFPVLRELNLPATVFLPTTMIGGTEPLAHDKAYWLAKTALERGVAVETIWRAAGLPDAPAREAAAAADVLELTDRLVYLPTPQRDALIERLESVLEIREYPKEYALLDWAQVREMSRAGIDFGDHTATHPVLPLEDEETFAAEIFASKTRLERELGRPATVFAYPNGRYNAAVRAAIVRAGYRAAVTTDKRTNRAGADLFALGRTCLCEESTRGVGGRFSPSVARLRFGLGASGASMAFFCQYPLEKLLAFSTLLSEIKFLF